MADQKSTVDWEDIRRDYEAGTQSIREIASWHNISDTAIRKRAKKECWVRKEVRTGSHRELLSAEPQAKVYEGTVLTPENTKPEAIVDRGRALAIRMLDELDATTCRQGELEALIETAMDGQDDKAMQAVKAAVSLKTRSDVLKALATAAKTFSESTAAAAGGKKAERQQAAENVGGRFAPPPPPSRPLQ